MLIIKQEAMLMNTNDEALVGVVDAAILDCCKHSENHNNHAVIPVRTAARAVAATAGTSEADFPQVLLLVCERSHRRGHVLAFGRI
jgi:hypothetical protein